MVPRTYLLSMLVVVLVGTTITPIPAEAQILDRVRNRVQREAERRVEDRAADAANRTMDSAEAAVTGQPVDQPTPPSGDSAATPGGNQSASSNAASLRPGEGVWANYDFVPGERPLFVEDFAGDRVGNFPRRLEFGTGNLEVVEWRGQRFLRATAMSAFRIPLPETLPNRFTIEFDAFTEGHEWMAIMTSPEQSAPINYSDYPGNFFLAQHHAGSLDGNGPKAETSTQSLSERLTPIRIAVDGSYAKMYFGEHRVVNVPNAVIRRGNAIHVIVWYGQPDNAAYIGNIRVMAGGSEMYDALVAEGRFATQGIHFDSGSDRLRPESTPTLRDIGDMLRQHPDLRIAIEGHTDSSGDAAANQSLSERRAAAVVAYLASSSGIDASRLEARGFGPSQPVAPNETPEGRQANRRVEVVKL